MPSQLTVSFGILQNIDGDLRPRDWHARKTLLPERKFTIDQLEIEKLQEDQEAIKEGLSEAMHHIDGTTASGQRLRQILESIGTCVTRASQYVNRLLNAIPISARAPTDQSVAKAQEVFDTPELLENILAFTTLPDMLSAMQVQRCWHGTVLGSVKIKRLLGLEPYEKGWYYSPFSKRFDELIPNSEGQEQHMPGAKYEEWVHVDRRISIVIEIKNMDKLALGSRVRQMMLCSIPFTAASLTFHCVHGSFEKSCGPSGRSYTVGDLADIIREKRLKHCRHHDCRAQRIAFLAEVELD